MGATYTQTYNAISLKDIQGPAGPAGPWGNVGNQGSQGVQGNQGPTGASNFGKTEVCFSADNGFKTINSSTVGYQEIGAIVFPGTTVTGNVSSVKILCRANTAGLQSHVSIKLLDVTSSNNGNMEVANKVIYLSGTGAVSDFITLSLDINTLPSNIFSTTPAVLLLIAEIQTPLEVQQKVMENITADYSAEVAILYKELLYTQPSSSSISNIVNTLETRFGLSVPETPEAKALRVEETQKFTKRISKTYSSLAKEGTIPPEILSPPSPNVFLDIAYLEINC